MLAQDILFIEYVLFYLPDSDCSAVTAVPRWGSEPEPEPEEEEEAAVDGRRSASKTGHTFISTP